MLIKMYGFKTHVSDRVNMRVNLAPKMIKLLLGCHLMLKFGNWCTVQKRFSPKMCYFRGKTAFLSLVFFAVAPSGRCQSVFFNPLQ